MLDKMVRLSKVGEVMEPRKITAPKTFKDRIAIDIASSVGFKIIY